MPTSIIEHIRQLTELLSALAPEKIRLVQRRSLDVGKTRMSELLHQVHKSSHTESEIAKLMGYRPRGQAFHVLKSATYQRLLNSVFHFDLRSGGYSEFGISFVKNQRYLYLAKVLTFLGKRGVAESLARRGLDQAESYELAANVIEFLLILQQSAVLKSNSIALTEYHRRLRHWLEVYSAEAEMTTLFNSIQITFAKRGSDDPVSKEKSLQGSFAAESAFKRLGTFNLGLSFFRLRAVSFQIDARYRDCIATCLEAETFVRSKPRMGNSARLAEFALKRLTCCIHLRDLVQGIDAVRTSERGFPKFGINWYVLKEGEFLLYMATLRFDEARGVYDDVTGATGFYDLPEFRRERWLLFHLYLLYATDQLRMSVKLNSKTTPTFKDFLRWMPSYVRDKAGYNSAVLILHILVLLDKRKWRQVFERLEALEAYRTRHLENKNRQADCFIRLLVILERSGFDYAKAKEMAIPVERELRQAVDSSAALEGLQILPFEWLWNKVLETLNTGKDGVRSG